jgi:hypothetical protein
MMLTIKEAAAELRVSKQWLKYWLVENPVDVEGVPFYVPTGRRWKFERQDLDRIRNHLRTLEAARLGPSIKSKVRLIGLMSQLDGVVTYEDRLRMREAKKRPAPSTDLIAELAVSSVLGPKPPRHPRARLPRFKRPTP